MSASISYSLNVGTSNKSITYVSLRQVRPLSYTECEYIWSYVGKLGLLTRNLLNAIARSSYVLIFLESGSPCKIKNVVTHLKLLSVVNIPFNLVEGKSSYQKIVKSLSIDDKEGLAMGALSLTMLMGDTVDSFSTFVNAFLKIVVNSSTQILSSLGIPIGFMLAGMGTVSRTVQIAKALNLHRQLEPSIFSEVNYTSKAIYKDDLEKRLGIQDLQKRILSTVSHQEMEKLQEKKKVVIMRSIPKDAIQFFERLFTLLDLDPGAFLTQEQLQEATKNIQSIRLHLEKKMKVDSIGILANILIISALSLFSLGITSSYPFVLMSMAFAIRLMSLIYQEQKIQLPEK